MNKHDYEIVDSSGYLVLEICSPFTNLTRQEYYEEQLAGEFIRGLSAQYGEDVYVASFGGLDND